MKVNHHFRQIFITSLPHGWTRKVDEAKSIFAPEIVAKAIDAGLTLVTAASEFEYWMEALEGTKARVTVDLTQGTLTIMKAD